jgi:dipeptidase D
MNRFLWDASQNHGLRISSLEGGNLRNAIPREAFAVVVVPEKNASGFMESVQKFEAMFKSEFEGPEPGLSFTAVPAELPGSAMSASGQAAFLRMIYGIPNGVMRMSTDMPGVVETSTNLAIVKVSGGEASALCLLRSAVDSAKYSVAYMTQAVMELAGAKVEHSGSYPGWKPNMNSSILHAMKKVYQDHFGKVPEIKVIHAGLECGIIGAVYPNLELISFGPTIRHPHSPDEKVNIPSVQKFWDYLVATLENAPVKH